MEEEDGKPQMSSSLSLWVRTGQGGPRRSKDPRDLQTGNGAGIAEPQVGTSDTCNARPETPKVSAERDAEGARTRCAQVCM